MYILIPVLAVFSSFSLYNGIFFSLCHYCYVLELYELCSSGVLLFHLVVVFVLPEWYIKYDRKVVVHLSVVFGSLLLGNFFFPFFFFLVFTSVPFLEQYFSNHGLLPIHGRQN